MKTRFAAGFCALAVLASGVALNTSTLAPAAWARDASASDLVGSWSNPNVGVWTFNGNGTGRITQSSVNGNPGQITTYFNWSVEPGNTLSYSPTRTTLTGSADSDRDQVYDSPKTYKQSFSVGGGQLSMGGQSYSRL